MALQDKPKHFRDDTEILKEIKDSLSKYRQVEKASGAVNGQNRQFNTRFPVMHGSLSVFLDGIRLMEGEDYSIINERTIKLNEAPDAGKKLIFDYMRLS